MIAFEHVLPTIAENLAYDEALLAAAEAGEIGEALRFWEAPTCAVVLGASGVVADDVRLEACQAAGVPVARRASGGGTVLLGPGCLCYSLVLDLDCRPSLRNVTGSYVEIMSRVGQAVGAEAMMAGSSDLAWQGRKFSGNAQKRGRRCLLHHGTLLHAFDLGLLSQFLKQPAKQPDYRLDRPHASFVMNLPLPATALKANLAKAWQAEPSAPPQLAAAVRGLTAARYGNADWTARR